jgi:hypothetical protein
VIGVLHRLQIEQQGREPEHTQHGGREDRALEAVRGPLPEDAAWRPRRAGQVIRHGVERALDADRAAQGTQGAELTRREAR